MNNQSKPTSQTNKSSMSAGSPKKPTAPVSVSTSTLLEEYAAKTKEAEKYLKDNKENKTTATRDLSNQLGALILRHDQLTAISDSSNRNRIPTGAAAAQEQLSAIQRREEDTKNQSSDLYLSLQLEQLLRDHGETKLLSEPWSKDYNQIYDRYEQAKQDGNHQLTSEPKSLLLSMHEEKYSQLTNLLIRATNNQEFKLVQGLVDELKPDWDVRYDKNKKVSQAVVDLGGNYVPPPTSLLREPFDDFYLDIRREYIRLDKPINFVDFVLNCFESVDTNTEVARLSESNMAALPVGATAVAAPTVSAQLEEIVALAPVHHQRRQKLLDQLVDMNAQAAQRPSFQARMKEAHPWLYGDEEEESDDSSRENEVAEEKANAEEAFRLVSNGSPTILASDFGKLIESMGTTYCEEEHRRTIKKISTEDESGNRIVSKESFVAWYIEWLFGDEESSDSD